MLDLYLVLDESGNLHKNSRDRYFIIGGYLTNNSLKARSVFRREIEKYRGRMGIDAIEIKGSTVSKENKVEILSNVFRKIKQNNIYIPIFIIVDKYTLKKRVDKVNIVYNYFIKIILKRLASLKLISQENHLHIKLDNKTIKVGSINTLEEYLQGEFFFDGNINVKKVSYLDSSNREEIQLADFICNYYWRLYEKEQYKKTMECQRMVRIYFPIDKFGKKIRSKKRVDILTKVKYTHSTSR